MATVTKAMHAVAIDGFGGLDQVQYRELPSPEPQTGEVLIRIHAAGVGICDAKQRTGEFSSGDAAFPLVLGAECAGVIVQVGPGVEADLHAGDEGASSAPKWPRRPVRRTSTICASSVHSTRSITPPATSSMPSSRTSFRPVLMQRSTSSARTRTPRR
ncbi:MAG: alcohol dehydrogenase catalytic domain-containing protein [Candidatus Velthaea sp.]